MEKLTKWIIGFALSNALFILGFMLLLTQNILFIIPLIAYFLTQIYLSDYYKKHNLKFNLI